MTRQGEKQPERNGRGAKAASRSRRGWRRFLGWKRLLAAALAAVLVVAVGLGALYAVTPIPDANKAASAQTSTVYYSDGKTVLGTFSSANRTAIPLSQMPVKTRQALIASEDRTFYTNNGVSWRGTFRALWNNVSGGSQQGGSTITQQYVKNYYLNANRSYTRKLREAFISLKLDRTMSKDDILKGYLNTAYFGRGAYGLEAAARAYWGIPAKKLTVAQGALLIGILPSPTAYDPAVNGKLAHQKWNRVLDSMVREKYLSATARAKLKFPKAPVRKNRNAYKGNSGYLLTSVRDELKRSGLTDSQIDGGGLKIVSTFDLGMQRNLLDTMNDGYVYPKTRPATLKAAATTIDPTSGAVRAMYGGSDYLKRQRNTATQDVEQAGSTFKPFALLTALQQGYSLNSTFDGSNRRVFPGYPKGVKNFDGESMPRANLIQALEQSINTVFVDLNNRVGPKNTMDTAVKAGLPAETSGLQPYLSNVLGTSSPHNIDMATAYATLASGGVKHETHVVERATGPDPNSDSGKQKTFYTGNTAGTRVFDAGNVSDLVYAMQKVVQDGTGNRAQVSGRPVAGKTGTSESGMSAWFVGFTPQLTTAVSLFNTNTKGTPTVIPELGGYGAAQGGGAPAAIFGHYMANAVSGMPYQGFPNPVWGGENKSGAAAAPAPAPSSSSSSPTQQPSDSPSSSSTSESPSSSSSSPSSASSSSSSPSSWTQQPSSSSAGSSTTSATQSPSASTSASPTGSTTEGSGSSGRDQDGGGSDGGEGSDRGNAGGAGHTGAVGSASSDASSGATSSTGRPGAQTSSSGPTATGTP